MTVPAGFGEGASAARIATTIEELPALPDGTPATIAGRVVSRDGDRILVADSSAAVWVRPIAEGAELGAWVEAAGSWQAGTLSDAKVWARTRASLPFPVPDGEWMWFMADGRRRYRALQQRARLLTAIRRYFDDLGFLEVTTPAVVPSPGLELHLDAIEIADPRRDGSDRRYLITSPEYQMKRLLAGGVGRCYQICACFRAGELGDLHEPEFTMLEWYRTFADAEAVMADTEAMVALVARTLNGGSTSVTFRGRHLDLAPPWPRMTVAEAFRRYAGIDVDGVLPDEDRFYRIMVETIEPELGRDRPLFLTAWPRAMASLAKLSEANPEVADRFEAYVDGMELCNGFGELTDAGEQRDRFEADISARRAAGKPLYPVDERFLAALAEGIPPSGGNALGIDRLLLLLGGGRALEDITAFPASRL